MSSTRFMQAIVPLGLLAFAGTASAQVLQPASLTPPAEAAPAAMRVVPGQEMSGSLDASDPRASDGTHYDDWTYEGKKGERITISLQSKAFDAYLRFGRTKGGAFSQTAENDDGGEGSNSLLQVTLPADGEYVIRVNTMVEETGAYTLRVTRRP